jgi:hypothetical protein
VGKKHVEAVFGQLAGVPPGLDGVGERLGEHVPRQDPTNDHTRFVRLADGPVPGSEHRDLVPASSEPRGDGSGEPGGACLPVREPLVDGAENSHR